jgi:hypothetical protein
MSKTTQMKWTFWNIRGLNKTGRINCLASFIRQNDLDFVGIQESKKASFSNGILESISKNMAWNFIPAKGTAGGILVGFRLSTMEIIAWQDFIFCGVAIVKNQSDGLTWRLVVVYGSPYEELKITFLEELELVMAKWQEPSLIGGDFNLVKSQREKSNGIVNFNHVDMFNDWINR